MYRFMDHTTPPHRLQHSLLFVRALCVVAAFWGTNAGFGADLRCQIEGDDVVCDVDVRSFMGEDIKRAMDNGWENMLLFRLYLYDSAGEVAVFSYAELHQRCYVDPFDAYCLAVWEGAPEYERFADVDALIEGVGRFRLRSAQLKTLAQGAYNARLQADLNPITDDQINIVRSWLARNRGGHLVVGSGDASMFGTFVSFFANITPGSAEASLVIEAPTLWIGEPTKTPEPEPD